MNSLTQIESNLIGSQKDILALEEKSSANILVISDTHGDYDVLCDIIEEFGHISDALWLSNLHLPYWQQLHFHKTPRRKE